MTAVDRPRYFATERQVTGRPYIHHAYVVDRVTGKVVASCMHGHGERGGHGGEKALGCAERMLRRLLRRGEVLKGHGDGDG
jgi:hypothetical protein